MRDTGGARPAAMGPLWKSLIDTQVREGRRRMPLSVGRGQPKDIASFSSLGHAGQVSRPSAGGSNLRVAVVAAVLAGVVGYALGVRGSRIAAQSQETARLDRHRLDDEVTGLIDAVAMERVAALIVEIARRDGDAVTMCVIEVTCAPNASSPHDALITVAAAAQDVFRAGDVVARLGEDTIAVVGKGAGLATSDAEERLRARSAELATPDEGPVQIRMGIAVLQPWDEPDLPALLEAAREAVGP